MIMKSKIVELYIQHYNNFEIDTMLELFTEDCVFENISNSSGAISVKGKEELKKLAIKSASFFSYRQQIVRNWVISDTKIAIEVDYYAVAASDFGIVKAGGIIQLKGVSIFEFVDDKIKRVADYS